MSEANEMYFEAQSRIMGEELSNRNAKVKVFGVGGAGGNTVNRMKQMNIEGVEYYAVNTDSMALDLSLADHKILIGEKSTKNLGAGMDPEKGRKAVEENIEELKESMKGADMVFVTAGMGGGTGTGAAPVVAAVAREMGILTVGVVTKPFRFEGNARARVAQKGIAELRAAVDTIIVVENKKLLAMLQTSNQKATMDEAFKMADEILGNAVQSICGIMFHHGLVHVDFADIRKVMQDGGSALMGTGCAQGEKRGIAAADLALASPLLEDISIEGATGVLINVAHGENYSLLEHSEAMEHIYEKVGEEGDPNIIIGDITVPELGDKVSITIIATGCGVQEVAPVAPVARPTQVFSNPFAGMQQQYVQPAAPVVQPAQQQPSVAPAQPARPTPRPTTNFLAMAGMTQQQPAPAVAPAAQPEMFVRQPAAVNVAPAEAVLTTPQLSDSQMFPAVGASRYGEEGFDATATAEETVAGKSETAEIAAVSDEDEYNGGRGFASSITSAYSVPAFQRQQETMKSEPAVTTRTVLRQEPAESAMKTEGVDYNMPAYLRMGSDLENF
ncbi:MAG: cell division protein FtsZ [Fibrobacter sp.]|nr:cell division protein FtsZ [Fibrobacter sp.]